MDELISAGKAAKMLGICTESLRQWQLAGKLEVVKTMGGHRRYRLEDIENLCGFTNILTKKQ